MFFKGMLTLTLVLGPTFYFGITAEETSRMGIAAAAGAAAAMLLNLDRLAEISLLGFSAKLRGVIKEAYATMDAVQTLAAEVIAANVRLITRGGRVGGGFELEDRIKTVDRFRKVAGSTLPHRWI